jgi:hypothetical protein
MRSTLLLTAFASLGLLAGLSWALVRPSHQRDWSIEQAVLPEVEIDEGVVRIRKLRDFRYEADGTPIPAYRDEEYVLAEVERVWFVLSPFNQTWRGPAHAFLSFEFRGGRHLAISVEARREAGEEYSVWKGMLKRYELMYVLGTEADLIGLRANIWKDPTYLYPSNAGPEKARLLLERLLERARKIHDRPEFYHTIGNNCTTNLLEQINPIAPRRIRLRHAVLLPGYSDEMALGMGLLDTELPLDQARERFRINGRAEGAYGHADYSRLIRRSPEMR